MKINLYYYQIWTYVETNNNNNNNNNSNNRLHFFIFWHFLILLKLSFIQLLKIVTRKINIFEVVDLYEICKKIPCIF